MDFSGLKKVKMKDHEKAAKMKALDDLKGVMQDMMRGDMDGGLKKVTVAADSKEGLSEGLEKAKEMLPEGEEESEMEEESEGEEAKEEMMELPEDAESLAKLEELIKQKLAKLQAKE